MDSGLLIDSTVTADKGVNHWMVGYWSTDPTMYTYEIYYSLLAGESSDRTYNGVGYKKIDEYTVGSTDYPSGQTALSFDGVTLVGKDYDSNSKVDGTVIRFYYKRIENTVTLDDNYGTTTPYTIPYGATLNAYITTVPTPSYPDELPVGAYEFGGWYQSKDGIGALDTSITMPNEDLIYYAKWNLIVYTVTINNGNGTVLSTEQVSYGSKAAKPTDPTMDDATFIGWYYKNTAGVEQRFDFDNMTITADMTIYAKWRSNVMKQVEIYYVVENEDGTKTQVADTETLMLRLGQTRTFEAKTGSSLYAEYRTGCFPTTASHSVEIDQKDIDSEDPVTYTFEYKQYGQVPYQVEFYVKESVGTKRPAFKVKSKNADTGKYEIEFVDSNTYAAWTDEEKANFGASNADVSSNADLTVGGQYIEQHWDNNHAVVVELYEPDVIAETGWFLPDAYLPDNLKVQKIIVPSTDDPENNITANTIEFIYEYKTPVVDPDPEDPDNPGTVYEAKYQVQHFIQNINDATVYDFYDWKEYTGYEGKTASASPISIPGYTYSYDVTDAKKQTNTTLTPGTDGAADVMTGTITSDDKLELNFYYTVNSYPYQVMYLEQDTNRVLAATKITDSDGDPLMGKYGSMVTEDAITIDGYDIVGSSTKSIYIQMEAGDTASVNTIVFYYEMKNADLIITKEVQIDAAQAEQEQITDENKNAVANQSFAFTVTAKQGFLSSVYDYTIYNADNSYYSGKITTKDTYTLNPISIIGGQRIQIHNLAMGEYTVTEAYVVGYRTTVNGTITPSATVTLDTAEQNVEVNFVNTFPFYTGDLVVMKKVMDGDTESTPDHTYKVKITLNPAPETRNLERVITFVNAEGEAYLENGTERIFTVPTLASNSATSFEITVDVPAGDEVKLVGAPAGTFTAEEITNGDNGAITDYYSVSRKVAVHKSNETRYEDGTSITSDIHGGHPTAVTFRNTYKKGKLTINKTVTQEYANDNWTSDTFTFNISGTTELPDGTYNIKIGNSTETVTVAGGKISLSKPIAVKKSEGSTKTSWSNSLTIENLPAGYYTVTEDLTGIQPNQYTVTSPAENQLVNSTTDATAFDFTNTYKRTKGTLELTKNVNNTTDAPLEAENFTFVVTMPNGLNYSNYDDVISATGGAIEAVEGHDNQFKVTISFVDDTDEDKEYFAVGNSTTKTVTISNLPSGDYTVDEEEVVGYGATWSSGNVAKVRGGQEEQPATLTCTNTYPVYTLTIKQTGVADTDSGIYEVIQSSDSNVDSSDPVIAKVMITGNASVTLEQVPIGHYIIREITSDWTWTYENTSEKTVDVTSDSNSEVTFNHISKTIDWLHNEAAN